MASITSFIDADPALKHLVVEPGEALNRRVVRDRCKRTSLILTRLAGEDGFLVVEPVDDEGKIVERERRTERDIGDGVDRGNDVESEVFFVFTGEAVTPQTTDIVLAVGEENIGDTTSVRVKI